MLEMLLRMMMMELELIDDTDDPGDLFGGHLWQEGTLPLPGLTHWRSDHEFQRVQDETAAASRAHSV